MVDVDDLRALQADFEASRQSSKGQFRTWEKLRQEFVKRFPPRRIATLTLDEYVQGKRNRDSFCYWVERKTSELGHIQGAPATKFGVFFHRKTQDFKFTSKFGGDIENLLRAIISLINAGGTPDLEKIREVQLSPMFKGKILFLYHPNRFLNIFSENHVNHFLQVLSLSDVDSDLDLIAKKELLRDFKMRDSVMASWTMYEFSKFLYWAWHPPARKSKAPKELTDYLDAFPPPKKTNPEFIDLEFGKGSDIPSEEKQKKGRVIDFEKQNRRNRRIGDQGEDIVCWAEKQRLKAKGRDDLAKRVEPICRKNSSAGYDVKSFELNGAPRHIEVKSTTRRAPSSSAEVSFHISEGERKQAKELSNFYIYIVFDVKSKHPQIWPIKNPAALIETKTIRLRPSSYRATLIAG